MHTKLYTVAFDPQLGGWSILITDNAQALPFYGVLPTRSAAVLFASQNLTLDHGRGIRSQLIISERIGQTAPVAL